MSLESWKAEFYPTDAHEVPEEHALSHSILKWTGLLKKNLDKHDVYVRCGRVFSYHPEELLLEDSIFWVDGDTCALCHHYARADACRKCPLSKVRGGVPCDSRITQEKANKKLSPYSTFMKNGDARPMLMWLKRADRAYL